MPTSEEVRKLMEQRNISMQEAKRMLVKQELMDACREATTFSELQEVLLRAINLAV